VLKDIIREYFQTIGEREYQAHENEPENTFSPFSLDLLASIISRQAGAKEEQDQLLTMTLYELLQNNVLMNQSYNTCVKDDGGASTEESKE
jgi:hypothetical protein